MTGPTTDTILNLGRYSIRPPEESSNLRVGSFYRRKQIDNATDGFSNNSLIYSVPKRRRVDTATSVVPNRHTNRLEESITSYSPFYDSDSAVTASPLIIDETRIYHKSVNNNNNRLLSANTDKSTNLSCQDCESYSPNKLSSQNQTAPLIIDTQTSFSSNKDDRDSHESFVLELNPETYKSLDDETTITSIRSSEELYSLSLRTPAEPEVRLKTYPKQLPYHKIMAGVVFVMSGIENPRKSNLRTMAKKMGAKYQSKWNRFCTHLICAFKDTPKYKEVMAENGRILREHWIRECSRERQLLDWRIYKLGNYPYPDSEEEVDQLD